MRLAPLILDFHRSSHNQFRIIVTEQTLEQLSLGTKASLWDDLIDHWFPRCIDPRGGFHQDFNRDWSPGPPAPHFVVFQARMTWVAATLAEERPEFHEVAAHGVEELKRFVEPNGAVKWTSEAEQRHVYGASFVIYALAAACRASGSASALELAKRVFARMESHLHDKEHGGYFEFTDSAGRREEWRGHSPSSQTVQADAIGTPYAMKSQNSHLHILEAFTELALVWPDPLLRQRLAEVIDILQSNLLSPEGSLYGIALPDWTPQPWPVSYGHNIEAAHLLLSASEALYGKATLETEDAAARLCNHTLKHGMDWEQGGIFNSGTNEGPSDRSKVWWVQGEALLGFARTRTLAEVDQSECERALLTTWNWIQQHQIDAEFGGWHDTIPPDGSAAGDGRKGHPWKAAYHDGRALLFTSRMLAKL